MKNVNFKKALNSTFFWKLYLKIPNIFTYHQSKIPCQSLVIKKPISYLFYKHAGRSKSLEMKPCQDTDKYINITPG